MLIWEQIFLTLPSRQLKNWERGRERGGKIGPNCFVRLRPSDVVKCEKRENSALLPPSKEKQNEIHVFYIDRSVHGCFFATLILPFVLSARLDARTICAGQTSCESKVWAWLPLPARKGERERCTRVLRAVRKGERVREANPRLSVASVAALVVVVAVVIAIAVGGEKLFRRFRKNYFSWIFSASKKIIQFFKFLLAKLLSTLKCLLNFRSLQTIIQRKLLTFYEKSSEKRNKEKTSERLQRYCDSNPDGRKTTMLTTKTLLFVTCEVCFVIRFSVGYDIEIVTVNYH